MENSIERLQKGRELFGNDEAFLMSSLDKGCQTATLYLRITNNPHDSKCTRCPFPNCVSNLSLHDRRILNKSKEIRELLDLHDNGINLSILCRRFKINYIYASKCIKKREYIRELLDQWGDIIRNKEAVKQFQIIA